MATKPSAKIKPEHKFLIGENCGHSPVSGMTRRFAAKVAYEVLAETNQDELNLLWSFAQKLAHMPRSPDDQSLNYFFCSLLVVKKYKPLIQFIDQKPYRLYTLQAALILYALDFEPDDLSQAEAALTLAEQVMENRRKETNAFLPSAIKESRRRCGVSRQSKMKRDRAEEKVMRAITELKAEGKAIRNNALVQKTRISKGQISKLLQRPAIKSFLSK